MKKIAVLLSALIYLYSPLTQADVSEATHIIHGAQEFSPTDPSDVKVYLYKPTFRFKIIGNIEARGMAGGGESLLEQLDLIGKLLSNPPSEKDDIALAMKALKEEAASIGADGVIIAKQAQVRVGEGATERRIAGIAIRSQNDDSEHSDNASTISNASKPLNQAIEAPLKTAPQAVATTSVAPTPPASNTPVIYSGNDGSYWITLPPGWEKKDGEAKYDLVAVNKTIDSVLFMKSIDGRDIVDMKAFAKSLMDKLSAKLTDVKKSKITSMQINGYDALKADIRGTLKNGIKVRYLGTMLRSNNKIIWLLTACADSRYPSNSANFERLAGGIQIKE